MIDILFDPAVAEGAMAEYPALRDCLGEPAREGTPSSAFSGWRRSTRHIYRVMTALHFDHLRGLASEMDRAIDAGWNQSKMLKTSDRAQFSATVSELAVARHLQLAGFEVSSPEADAGNDTTPDIEASKDELRIRAEVYTPHDWKGADDYLDALRTTILHVDHRSSYRFELSLARESSPPGSHFNEWRFSRLFETPADLAPVVCRTREVVIEALAARERTSVLLDEHPQTDTQTFIQISEVELDVSVPRRYGTISRPSYPPYAPEGMWNRVLEGKVARKAAKNQVGEASDGHLRVLYVDTDHLAVRHEFESEWYFGLFVEALERFWAANRAHADVVLFFTSHFHPRFSFHPFVGCADFHKLAPYTAALLGVPDISEVGAGVFAPRG